MAPSLARRWAGEVAGWDRTRTWPACHHSKMVLSDLLSLHRRRFLPRGPLSQRQPPRPMISWLRRSPTGMVMSAFDEATLLENARSGDEQAFAELAGVYQGELRSYCYRMLGSVQDAEDAVQNALLRAWRGLDKFEGRSSIRSWLYSIATNTTLDITRHRSRRELPADFGPAADLGAPMQEAINDPIWLEPYPDQWLGAAPTSPESRYEQR